MDELEKAREAKRWARWGGLSWLGKLLKVGTVMRTDSGDLGAHKGEAPMVELAKLAEEGIQEPRLGGKLPLEVLEQMMVIFNHVALADGSVSDEEKQLVTDFVEENVPEGTDDTEMQKLQNTFIAKEEDFQRFRNTVFLLKKALSQPQTRMLVEELYRMAYLGGLETEESKEVFIIGGKLGLSNSDLRLASTKARKKIKN